MRWLQQVYPSNTVVIMCGILRPNYTGIHHSSKSVHLDLLGSEAVLPSEKNRRLEGS